MKLRTDEGERTVAGGDSVQLRCPVGVDEIDVLLDCHVVEHVREEVVVVHVDDGPTTEAGCKREEFFRIGRAQPVRHDHKGCGGVTAHGLITSLIIRRQAL